MSRSVNSVTLIGNLTRDPELRYTPSGRPVCNIRLATNRQWKTENGQQQEQTEYHTIILWGKLADTASQYLKKGEKAYFQGRLQTRSYTAKDGTEKQATEIIAEDMLMLGGRIQEGAQAKGKSDVAKAASGNQNSSDAAAQKAAEDAPDTTDQNAFNGTPEEIPF